MLFFVLLMLARACHPLAHRIHLEKGDAGHQEIQKNDQTDQCEQTYDNKLRICTAKESRKRAEQTFARIEYIKATADETDHQNNAQKDAYDAHNFISLPSGLRQIRRCGDPLRS